ncbi:MAG: hypothetical protein CMD33_01025 [Flavobacteriales bacterium]|nr:hypothetical protein [Flavobacteriales bacterium]
MSFTPSVYSQYGNLDDAPAEGSAGYEQYLQQYGPAVLSLIAGKSPREKYEILKAKIQNQQKLYKSTRNTFFKNIIAANINKLQAQLRAAEYELAEDVETSEFLRYSKGLTLGAGVLGLGMAMLIGLSVLRTMGAVRRAADRK